MLLPEWSTAVFVCFVIVVHESLVCPGQLNCLLFFRKILELPQIIWFSSIFVYLNPFQQWLYDFEIHLFTPRTTEELIYNYYRRFKHSLMLQKENSCLAALIRLFPKHNLWIWRWAHALNFFGRPWRGLFWVEPVLLNRCMVLATMLQLSFSVMAIFL